MAPRDQKSDLPPPQSTPGPPSTFPGIWKFPTGFGEPFRTANDWMNSKRKDDDIGDLWRVHDKLYDLAPFMPQHPGGAVWLELTQGTDITEAFEVSHLVNVSIVEATLAKHFVRNATTPRISPYVFNENGFFKTLKRKIGPVLKEVGTGPTTQIILMQESMLATFLVTMILGTIWSSYLLKTISGVVLAVQLIGAHNFFHLKDNWRKYYFDMGLLSSHEWRVTHALSHHLYPNTLMDIELELFPTYQFLPNRPKTWLQKYAPPFYSHFLYLIGFWLDFGKRLYNVGMGRQTWRIENGIVLAQLALLSLIAPSWQEGLCSWLYIHTVTSFTFLTQGATAAHHHPEQFHDGDESRPDPDFGLSQLDSTWDRAGDYRKHLWVNLITFGEHQLHHLFPTVCHSKLHHLRPLFEETLEEFKESFPLINQWDMYKQTFTQLKRTEVRTRKSKKEN